MRIANPNEGKPFHRVVKTHDGEPLYGYRNAGTSDEEIVHIPTGQSNQNYYTSEKVTNYDDCSHEFDILDIRKREVECARCHIPTTFIAGQSYREIGGQSEILHHHKWYPLNA